MYEKEIRAFDVKVIREEYNEALEKLKKDYYSLLGKRKFAEVKKIEGIDRAVGFIFSRSGFIPEAEEYCKEKGIACSEDERWLDW